jgi:hypothetical protein
MNTIYKYPLEITDVQTIDLPNGAEVLDVAVQDELPVLWALVDTEEITAPVEVYTFGTGIPISTELDDLVHISTYQIGGFVGHVFIEIGDFDFL